MASNDGEKDLLALLRTMRPVLCDTAWVFATRPETSLWQPPEDRVFAQIREDEGTTFIVPEDCEVPKALAVSSPQARITLQVHSSLEAVGLTAEIAQALCEKGISANVIAGYYHDHVFLPFQRRQDALSALRALSQPADPV